MSDSEDLLGNSSYCTFPECTEVYTVHSSNRVSSSFLVSIARNDDRWRLADALFTYPVINHIKYSTYYLILPLVSLNLRHNCMKFGILPFGSDPEKEPQNPNISHDALIVFDHAWLNQLTLSSSAQHLFTSAGLRTTSSSTAPAMKFATKNIRSSYG